MKNYCPSLFISTQNGTGSLSANQILLTGLFKAGHFVGSKNIFPSNIAGLATQYFLRWSNVEHLCGFQTQSNYLLNIHLPTLNEDLLKIKNEGVLIIDSDYTDILKNSPNYFLIKKHKISVVKIPYKDILKNIEAKAPIKKLLKNIISTSFLSEVFNIDNALMQSVLKEKFTDDILQVNKKAFVLGLKEAKKQIQAGNIVQLPKEKTLQNKKHSLLIDGNIGAAMGILTAGCQVFSWYPITPSTSVAENIKTLNAQLKTNSCLTMQSEDELSAISMTIGAGWAGARAATATSGPGLSLMAEALGYAYFAEIPLVVGDVQRMGPSTGLPTKTSQGDLCFAAQISHGDCQSIILLPSNPEECFTMNYQAFDIAHNLQTPVLILSDLDIGMNLQSCGDISYPSTELQNGKLSHTQPRVKNWEPYADPDKDYVPIRSLPGSLQAYLTRGTGHNQKGDYSEDPENFSKLLKRLRLKYQSCLKITPPPVITKTNIPSERGVQIIAYGSTDQIIKEVQEQLQLQNCSVEYLKIQSYPLHTDIMQSFLKNSSKPCFIIEQNISGQMKQLITQALPEYASQFTSITHYNGLPIDACSVTKQIIESLK
ncbi:MAG: hypothetical protein HAW63_02720 [Bdellovibrionaceae bacterium]|nr:hypothetical protein [Pseudobdellovibrionaceae bacterium]